MIYSTKFLGWNWLTVKSKPSFYTLMKITAVESFIVQLPWLIYSTKCRNFGWERHKAEINNLWVKKVKGCGKVQEEDVTKKQS